MSPIRVIPPIHFEFTGMYLAQYVPKQEQLLVSIHVTHKPSEQLWLGSIWHGTNPILVDGSSIDLREGIECFRNQLTKKDAAFRLPTGVAFTVTLNGIGNGRLWLAVRDL